MTRVLNINVTAKGTVLVPSQVIVMDIRTVIVHLVQIRKVDLRIVAQKLELRTVAGKIELRTVAGKIGLRTVGQRIELRTVGQKISQTVHQNLPISWTVRKMGREVWECTAQVISKMNLNVIRSLLI